MQERPIDPNERPGPDQMLPFEWLYWHLIDKDDQRAANAMRHLIADRKQLMEDVRWQANRRHEERQKALEDAAKACPHRPTRAAIRIAYYSGMRLGEIERAERLEAEFLLRDTKNGEPRLVPMHRKVRCCAHIRQGSRFQTGYHFRQARAEMGMEHVHFHDLRHSAASALLRGGESLYEIGKVLGHKSQVSTARYAHMEQERMRDAVGRIA